MRVPLYDPAAEYQELREPIDEAIRRVLESGVYTGSETDREVLTV